MSQSSIAKIAAARRVFETAIQEMDALVCRRRLRCGL